MNITATNLLKIAATEVGYREKASNSQLDNPTANAGSGNWTKYARDLHNAGYYNGNKNGYSWCDVFVDWCVYQLCGRDAKKAQAIQCQTGSLGAGCGYSAQYYKNQGRFFTDGPQPGDQIFFGSGSSCEHTGIVEKVANGYVHTIEGNSENRVMRRSYPVGSGRILGYGRPKFEREEESDMSKFVDVNDNAWYAKAVDFCAEHGIMSGVSANKFGVGQNATREELAMALMRIYQALSKEGK